MKLKVKTDAASRLRQKEARSEQKQFEVILGNSEEYIGLALHSHSMSGKVRNISLAVKALMSAKYFVQSSRLHYLWPDEKKNA